MSKDCPFCIEPCIIDCMNRSVNHKHSEEEKTEDIIDSILQRENEEIYLRYSEVILDADRREFIGTCLKGQALSREYAQLLEYYKFRVFVPAFAKSVETQRAMSYYYQRLKHYYKAIKRKLNLTVSSQASSSIIKSCQSESSTVSLYKKQELLKEIKEELESDLANQEKQSTTACLVDFKSESKALEELVQYLKVNPKFDKIKTLKTEDGFGEQRIFQETAQRRAESRAQRQKEVTFKKSVKNKLFQKMFEGTVKKDIPTFQAEVKKEHLKQRSRSIKIVRGKSKQQDEKIQSQQKCLIFKAPQIMVKASHSTKTLLVRNKSLSKINSQHYESPYKRKAISHDKGKTTTAILAKNIKNSSNEAVKIKNWDAVKGKEIICSMKVLKFENGASSHSTPISPTERKTPRPSIAISKTDNVVTIRKKRLQALMERAGRK